MSFNICPSLCEYLRNQSATSSLYFVPDVIHKDTDDLILISNRGVGDSREWPDNWHYENFQILSRAVNYKTAMDSAYLVFDELRRIEFGLTLPAVDGNSSIILKKCKPIQKPFPFGKIGRYFEVVFNIETIYAQE